MEKQDHEATALDDLNRKETLVRERSVTFHRQPSIDEELNKVVTMTDMDAIRAEDQKTLDTPYTKLAHVDDEDMEGHHKEPVKTRHIVECGRGNKSLSAGNLARRDRRTQSLVGVENKSAPILADAASSNIRSRSNSHNENTADAIVLPINNDIPNQSNNTEKKSTNEVKDNMSVHEKNHKTKSNESIVRNLDNQQNTPEKIEHKKKREDSQKERKKKKEDGVNEKRKKSEDSEEKKDRDKTKKTSAEDLEHDKHRHRHHHHHHHHHHHGKRRGEKDPVLTHFVRSGTETKLDSDVSILPTELEEAIILPEKDLDDMTIHRLEDVPAVHRHPITNRKKTPSKFTQYSSDGQLHKKSKQVYDHTPHEVFVELEELKGAEWKETARWIKFEEDLEERADRWGKPHVATLSFHSLLELRRCFEYGTVLLDLEKQDFPDIVNAIVNDLATTNQLSASDRNSLIEVLQLKHSHHHDHHSSSFFKYMGSVAHLAGDEENVAENDLHTPKKGHTKRNRFNWLRSSSHDIEAARSTTVREKGECDIPIVKFSNYDDDNDTENGITFFVPNSKPTEKKSTVTSSNKHEYHDKELLKKIPTGSEGMTVLVGSLDMLDCAVVAFVRLSTGHLLDNMMQVPIPVRFFFMLLGPSTEYIDYREVGRAISTLMSNKIFKEAAYKANCRADLLQGVNFFLDGSVVLPPGEWDKDLLEPVVKSRQVKSEDVPDVKEFGSSSSDLDPLMYTKECGSGLLRDMRRRYAHYLSDYTDAFNLQCLTASVFIFFACMAPAITFGAILGDYTQGVIGVSETIVATSICGIIYAVLAGQPLLIMGATGPILVFEEALFDFCQLNHVDFLTMRVWVGLWVFLILSLVVLLQGSFLIRYLTRFTEEIFASLISLIFIYEAIKNLLKIYATDPVLSNYCNASYVPKNYAGSYANYTCMGNYTLLDIDNNGTTKCSKPHPNTALLSTMYFLGTFGIIYAWRVFRRSKFLGTWARHMVCDLGIMITIIIMVLINVYGVGNVVYIKRLDVRPGFLTLSPYRYSWLVNPFKISIGWIFAAFIPAALVSILLFMEIEVTELLMNKKNLKMRKGSGFHLDLMLNGLCVGIFSLFGLPWMCSATVRSASHLKSLTVYSKCYAPGEKPQVLYVREQRLTALLIHVLMGISLYFTQVIEVIPYAVILGVLLYMGIASITGIQLFKRFKLLFMPLKHHNEIYVKNVPTRKIYSYTLVQVFFLTLLWIVKLTAAAIAFPILVLFLIPIRKALGRFYTASELEALDSEEDNLIKENEIDEYAFGGIMPD